MKKSFFFLWLAILLGWLLYSYTQIDLNLTLTKISSLNNLFKSFQYIGYWQRPLSTYLYLFLLFGSYLVYLFLLRDFKKGLVTRKSFWTLTLISVAVLLISYPAFSYDIFNYMFDAKTIIFYHANPWVNRPLDFKGDPWLSFMHWTHRPSVYPPGWILLSIPFYVIGLNYFITILFSFKIFMALGYLGCVWMLEKILTLIKAKNKLFLVGLFAFNPLVILESLVSGHNDVVMMFFVLSAIWLGLRKKYLSGMLTLLFSAGVKYLGILLLPVFALAFWKKRPLNIKDIKFSFLLMLVVFLYFAFKLEVQGWYLLWILPLLVISDMEILYPIVIALSLGLMLRYAPFLYLGNWNDPVPTYKFWLTIAPLFLALVFTCKNKLWPKK